ncbi:IS5 family transposase [Paracraurococcus ruber]|uniref:IS5/IS1182 family transposase n=2 Tax=Paracraurococcus ruber TaxID=77675 RepID=A0ABS1D8J5_9PROT|nr:IS5 family transposase [Paracraurococcus ruber]MBK1662823.1 IS5/IS1182 family transposase [Paracraurococcus ruber]TDG04200.1 IS5 family transposase [Paracraurococcus ruber]
MTGNAGIHVLSDKQWAELEPLIDEVRPHCKVSHENLRQTIEAILWRHQNGAKWRAIPGELGPWWKAAQTFIRWSRLGVWERLLDLVQEGRVALGMAFLDGTNLRAHQKAAGAKKRGANSEERDRREALGRSRGGYGTKACVIADGRGRAAAFTLAPGQAHELPMAPDLLDELPDVPGWVVGDRGYASDAFRERIWTIGARPAIPPKRTDAPVACPSWIYNNRHLVENLWARLKEWRAVATRYEKTARSFLGVLCFAATLDWLRS